MVKVFLTGGSGYLGSTLLARIPPSWEVVALSRDRHTDPPPKGARFVQGDLLRQWDPSQVEGCDVIIHLAGLKGSNACEARPMEAVGLNVIGTHRLLQAAIEYGVPRFIFSSSYWVYGVRNNPPYREEMPVAPDELYGLTKAVSEMELQRSELDYTILRFTNLFGQGVGPGREEVIFRFITNALRGDPLILQGGGQQELDFLDVREAARILATLATDSRASRRVLNIGSGSQVSIAALASVIGSLIQAEYGREAVIERCPQRELQNTRRFVSMENFRQIFPEMEGTPPLINSLRRYVETLAVGREAPPDEGYP